LPSAWVVRLPEAALGRQLPVRKVTTRLSFMESNEHRPDPSTPEGSSGGAPELLHDLDADRATLAGRMAATWWFYPAFGVITALYVATPAIEPEANRHVVTGIAIASAVVLPSAYQRVSGVKVSRVGVRGAVILGALMCATLALLSTSFGLAAADAQRWIVIPGAVGFGLVVILGRRFDRVYRAELRRGR
jgi:hypothetical protein